jgi:hypothetical protein
MMTACEAHVLLPLDNLDNFAPLPLSCQRASTSGKVIACILGVLGHPEVYLLWTAIF